MGGVAVMVNLKALDKLLKTEALLSIVKHDILEEISTSISLKHLNQVDRSILEIRADLEVEGESVARYHDLRPLRHG
jgi:hypothetical protein